MMTDTEKGNKILLAIYDELGEGQLEKIDEIYNWEKNKGRWHPFSKQLPQKTGIHDYPKFCRLMLELCESKFLTAEILDKKYIKGGYQILLDKRSFHFYNIKLSKKGRKECKKIKKCMELKANEILLAIYKEVNGDIYEKIQYLDNTWNGGIYENDYRHLIMLLEEQGYIKWEKVDSLNSKTYITTFQDVRLTQNGKLKCESLNKNTIQNNSNKKNMDKVFIVHGHDGEAKEKVARFIDKLDFEPIILHEQVSLNKTIIEKIEEYSDFVDFGIVLYTPCDVGAKNETDPKLKKRARQNVVFEHGYLMAKIKRSNVCALVKGDVETPSDIDGILYIPMDDDGAWKFKIAQEMNAVGYDVDMNKLIKQKAN